MVISGVRQYEVLMNVAIVYETPVPSYVKVLVESLCGCTCANSNI